MSTIIKQGALAGIEVGLLTFVIIFTVKMASLQHAMTLAMIPPQVP